MSVLVLAILTGLSGLMAYFTATLVKWGAEAKSPSHAATVLFLLAMMAEMLVGALVYYAQPSEAGAVAGLWVAGGTMSVSVFPVFWVLARDARRAAAPGAGEDPPRPPGAGFLGAAVALVLVNEVLMGVVFGSAAGTFLPLATAGSPAGLGGLLVAAVNSPWFLLTMAAEMAITTVLLRDRLSRAAMVVLLAQGLIMAFSPPVSTVSSWVALSVAVSSGAMIALFVFVFEYLYRHLQVPQGFSRYLVELLGIYAVMMAGLFVWLYAGSGWLFAVSVVLEMVIFIAAALRPEGLSAGDRTPWQLRPAWTFAVLLAVFVAELFMGAVFDLQLQPADFLGALVTLPLSGPATTVVLNAVSNGCWFVANVTNSTWFLAMMGLEMGALVWFKLRESRNRENRIRLALMMGSFGAFYVFFPSIYFSSIAPHAPDPSQVAVLGWSMGLGSYPVAPAIFLALFLTYAITGALAVLFGRRAVCSVFCAAPLMYQGTTIDAMRRFNQTSRVGRKYLSSQLRWAYSATTGVTMASLAFVSVASYLDSIGRWNLTILGADPSVFFFAFSFSVLWYVMFVAIPYVGDYNCVTMGWCYTGTIVQAFQKVGFYRLKVRSREVCKACTTVDCARACPVGLVDMPGHFRTKGEFRSTKCCGVGNCVGACPYGNLYIYDVRHWLTERWGRRRGTSPSASLRLPMLRPGTGPAEAPTPASSATGAGAAGAETRASGPEPHPL